MRRRKRRSKVVLTDQLGRETTMEVEHGQNAKRSVRWTFRIEV